MTETEIWTKWESQVVNGVFPLRRFLGRSNHSVVFLTDCKAHNLSNAAIKIIPADPPRAEAQLSRWRMAATLSHPHLIRVLESGRCKLGGHPFLFVVTEYAEQNLAQILPHRALTADEVREMLIPSLDALAFLHRQSLVQGQLKPSNFLVVNDQLKLASDTVRPAGNTPGIDASGDMRALGATIMEALTRTRPGLDDSTDALSLPATLSPGLANAIRRCLRRDPAERPTVSDLQNQINPAPPAPAPEVPALPATVAEEPTAQVPASQVAAAQTAEQISAPPASAPPVTVTPEQAPPASRRAVLTPKSLVLRLIPAAAVAAIVLVALWAGNRAMRSHTDTRRPPIADQTTALPASSLQAPQAVPIPATAATAASPVLHEEIPEISRGSRESIRGQIKVAVRVSVDRAGNVIAENLEAQGSSKYFARLATQAAKKWKFAPDKQSSREWLVQFEFSHSGVTGHAVSRARQ